MASSDAQLHQRRPLALANGHGKVSARQPLPWRLGTTVMRRGFDLEPSETSTGGLSGRWPTVCCRRAEGLRGLAPLQQLCGLLSARHFAGDRARGRGGAARPQGRQARPADEIATGRLRQAQHHRHAQPSHRRARREDRPREPAWRRARGPPIAAWRSCRTRWRGSAIPTLPTGTPRCTPSALPLEPAPTASATLAVCLCSS